MIKLPKRITDLVMVIAEAKLELQSENLSTRDKAESNRWIISQTKLLNRELTSLGYELIRKEMERQSEK